MTEVKLESKGWSEKLSSMIQFPGEFTFYYNKGNNIVQVALLETKGRLENTRWGMIKSSVLRFHPKDLTAIVAVKEV